MPNILHMSLQIVFVDWDQDCWSWYIRKIHSQNFFNLVKKLTNLNKCNRYSSSTKQSRALIYQVSYPGEAAVSVQLHALADFYFPNDFVVCLSAAWVGDCDIGHGDTGFVSIHLTPVKVGVYSTAVQLQVMQ